MSFARLTRLLVATLAVVAGMIGFASSPVAASVSTTVSFSFPTALTVGASDVPASITITNDNTSPHDVLINVVCESDTLDPPCADPDPTAGTPSNDKGINFVASCADYSSTLTCIDADPGVFSSSATGTGSSACDGISFDITVSDPTYGTWRFDPSSTVELAPGEACTIDFTVSVEKMPTKDQDPSFQAGIQTAQIADVAMYADGTALDAYDADSSNLTIAPTPEIVTQATPSTTNLGSVITDTATVSGRVNPDPSGEVRFRLYGPDDDDCSGTPVMDQVVAMPTNADVVTSPSYAPTQVGTYRWIASYEGDASNGSVSGACNDENESVVVDQAVPELATSASSTIRLGGGQLTDSAVVSGRVGPQAGATIDFALYGPSDPTCTGDPIFTDLGVAYPVEGGAVSSAPYTPTEPGTYRWIASYSGDVNNAPVSGACGDAGEETVVQRALPELVTDAGDDVVVGEALADTATVTGRVDAGSATIDFRLYGPGDTNCTDTPVFEQLGVAFGPGDTTVTSDPFTPTEGGTYRWVASYSGDANNEGVVGECGDPTETVDVLLAQPTIVTQASPGVPVDVGQLSDIATVNGRVDPQPGATIDFRLYGPNDDNCAGTPIFQDLGVPYPVSGGSVRSASFTPTIAGTYRWVATYSGDANNLPAEGECGDPAETVVVTSVSTELPATGSETETMMRIGGAALLGGLALVSIGRRRRFVRS